MEECLHEHCVCDTASGDTVCTDCGLVVESFAFASAWDCGSENVDETREVPEPSRKRLAKLEPHLSAICSMLRLSDHVAATAKQLALKLIESSITLRESSIRAFAAALVYQACKLHNVDRAESEFVASGYVTSRDLAHANKRCRREMSQYVEHRATNPGYLVQRFMNLLSRDYDTRTLAVLRTKTEEIITRVGDSGMLAGKTPECACATCLVLAAKEVLGNDNDNDAFIRLMCQRCGLTQATIANALKTIRS